MAIEGLTDQQSDFIERFLKVPRVFKRKQAKARRAAAIEQFQTFNAASEELREVILTVEDAGVRSILLARLGAAEAAIEADPANLDFAAGHALLMDVEGTTQLHRRQQEARPIYAALEGPVAPFLADGEHPDPDIALAWTFVEEKYASGMKANDAADLEQALRAMARLEGMIKSAADNLANPFREAPQVARSPVEEAREGLKPEVIAARRRLSDVYNQLEALKGRIALAFAEGQTPLELTMGCTAVGNLVTQAADAAPGDLPGFADRAEEELDRTHRLAQRLIREAEIWQKDHAAFLVRYGVMQAHGQAAEANFVKPRFDEITAAYEAARERAARHEYREASTAIALVRNNLKDALDFADDYAAFLTLRASRAALLNALPARNTCPDDRLKEAHDKAKALLTDADAARDAGQMATARGLLNQIPQAAAELQDSLKFARIYNYFRQAWEAELANLGQHDAEVIAAVQSDIDYGMTIAASALEALEVGNYRRASALMGGLANFQGTVMARAQAVDDYRAIRTTFTDRLTETRDRQGPEGRVAIESYYQALVTDDQQRQVAEAKGDYKLARALCERREADHPAMMALADEAKVYLAEKATYDEALARLAGEGMQMADAQAALAVARDMAINAADAKNRGNWPAATVLLRNAIQEMRRAISAAQTDAQIDGLQDANLYAAVETPENFAAALAEFEKVRAHVAGQDTGNLFTDALAAAAQKAAGAEAQVGTDAEAVRATLQEATADCKAVALQILAAAGYETQRQNAEALKGEAEGANDGRFDDYLAAIEARYDASVALADGKDFEGALTALAEVQKRYRAALDLLKTWREKIKPARDIIKNFLKELEKPEHDPEMAEEAKRLRELMEKMIEDCRAGKLASALAGAARVPALLEGVRTIYKHYLKAKAKRKEVTVDWVFDKLPHPATADEEAEIDRLKRECEALYADRAFFTAFASYWTVHHRLNAAEAKAADFDLYKPEERQCLEKLRELEDQSSPAAGPGHLAVTALRERYDKAIEQEKLGNFKGARRRLDGFLLEIEPAQKLLNLFARYRLHRDRAQAALTEVQGKRGPAIEPLLARLEGKDRNATRKGEGFDFEIAIALFQELEDGCRTALGTLATQKNFADLIGTIKEIEEGDLDDLKAAIAAADATLSQIQGRPSSMYVMSDILARRAELKAAREEAEEDFDAARAKVVAVVDACPVLALRIGQYDQLNDSANQARALGQGLRDSHPQAAFARAEIAARLELVEGAMQAARASDANRGQAQTDIETAIAELRDLRRVLDAHAAYLAARTPVEATLLELEKEADRFAVQEELTEARRHLDTAQTRATDHDHASATTEVKQAGLKLEAAKLKLKLAHNETPTPREVKDILNAPGGDELLDGIVNGLEPDVQRAVVAVAFEARFGCKLDLKVIAPNESVGDETELDRPAPNLRRFYAEMSKLPASDTLDNDSMLTFMTGRGKATGSAYSPGEKKILMREGDEERSIIYGIALEHEIGDIAPEAQPKPGEERTYFSWNTLHEVGHAVDDKLSYMKKHGARLAGWKAYGRSVGEVADAIAGEFDFDKSYIAEYMMAAEGTDLSVPDPDGCDPDEWERRRMACCQFVDRARAKNRPWSSARVAAACAIGDYTYVESYERDWHRYLTSARKLGVSGYQFRAPGEWFSELYAALHTDRLNDSHPHRAEFATLEPPEGA